MALASLEISWRSPAADDALGSPSSPLPSQGRREAVLAQRGQAPVPWAQPFPGYLDRKLSHQGTGIWTRARRRRGQRQEDPVGGRAWRTAEDHGKRV